MANPSGLLQGAIMMLVHLGEIEAAEKIQNAWLKTIEDGIHTYDIYKEGISKQKVGTNEFADAIIERLSQQPVKLKAVKINNKPITLKPYQRKAASKKELTGVDLFIHWSGTDANEIGHRMNSITSTNLKLNMISNRGIKVFPNGIKETFCTDHWRCRYKAENGKIIDPKEIIELLSKTNDSKLEVIKTENLYNINDKPAYSLGQGQ